MTTYQVEDGPPDEQRVRCSYEIEGPRSVGTARRLVWWRRPCKRWAQPGTNRCWQHR